MSIQFMTRYSRFIWAPDIKAVHPDVAQKLLAISTAEQLWWQRLVYERKSERGRDLIVHLVRIPPTKVVDYGWADEPSLLKGTTATLAANSDTKIVSVHACRPYHYEERQQVVHSTLPTIEKGGNVSFKVPPFRYHTMLIIRLEESAAGKAK